MDQSSRIPKQILLISFLGALGFFAVIIGREHPEIGQFYKKDYKQSERPSSESAIEQLVFNTNEESANVDIKPPSNRFYWKSEVETQKALPTGASSEIIPIGDKYYLKGVLQNSISLLDVDEQVVWTLQLKKEVVTVNDFALTDNQLILRVNELQLLAVDLFTGDLLWHSHLNVSQIKRVIATGGHLFTIIVDKGETDLSGPFERFAEINLKDGSLINISPLVGFLENVQVKVLDEHTLMGVNGKNYFFTWNLQNNTIENRHLIHEMKITPVTFVGDFIFFGTLENSELHKYNRISHELIWSSPIRFKVSEAPFYISVHNLIAVQSQSGYLQVFDAKKGESEWRFNIRNQNSINTPQMVRLNGKGIKKFELGWRYKGWVLGMPCSKGRLCLLDPQKGRILSRLDFDLKDLMMPPVLNKSWGWSLGKSMEDEIKVVKIIEKIPGRTVKKRADQPLTGNPPKVTN